MKQKTLLKTLCICSLVVLFLMPEPALAQQSRGRGRGIYGDWEISMTFGEREMKSILAFSRNAEGYTGQWISSWFLSDLDALSIEENKLSFTQTMRFGDQPRTSKFVGTIDTETGKLTGVLSGEQGDTDIKGQRMSRPARGVGIWDMEIKAGEREYTGILTISAAKEGELKGHWKSERGESELSDVAYEDRKLTFKRTIKREDREIVMAFEGTIGTESLEGVYKSEWGEAPATAKRIGGAAIGTWDLNMSSDRGDRKQRLRVNPDMSALYGSTLIKKIDLEGNNISFKYSLTFGDQSYESSFKGTIAETKLTGEMTTSRGTRKVTGTKRPSRRGRRPQP
jgi:hypothetical protein